MVFMLGLEVAIYFRVGVYGRIWDFAVRAAIELQMYRGPQLSSRKLVRFCLWCEISVSSFHSRTF